MMMIKINRLEEKFNRNDNQQPGATTSTTTKTSKGSYEHQDSEEEQ